MDSGTGESIWMQEIQYDDVKEEAFDAEEEKLATSDSQHGPNIMYVPLAGVDDGDEDIGESGGGGMATQPDPEQEQDDGTQRRANAKRKCRESAEAAIASSLRHEEDGDEIEIDDDRGDKDASDVDDDKDDGSDVSVTPTKKTYKKPVPKTRPAPSVSSNAQPERKGFFAMSAASSSAMKPWNNKNKTSSWNASPSKPATNTSTNTPPVRKLFGFNNSTKASASAASSAAQKSKTGWLVSPPKNSFRTSTPPVLKSALSFKTSAPKAPMRIHSSIVEPKKYQQMLNKPAKHISLTGGMTSRPSQFTSFSGGTMRTATTHLMSASKSMQTDAPEVYPVPDRNDRRRALRKLRAPKKKNADGTENGDNAEGKELNIDMLIDRVRYKCKYCDKLMRTEMSMRRHVLLHTNQDGYGCSQCNARYPTRDDLRLHERVVHEGECNFRCSACNYLFVRASYLRTHVRTQAHKDVVAGKAKPKPQVFKDGLPMHSKPPSDQRRPINKKEEKITDGPEWETIIPPELKTALEDAHRKQQERLEEARKNVIRAGGVTAPGKHAAGTPGVGTTAAADSNNAATNSSTEPARADGVPKVVSGTVPPAAATSTEPAEPTPPPASTFATTEENLQKFLAQLIRRQGGPGEANKTHQAEKMPVKIYRYNYCAVCRRYIDDPANPLGMRLHRHSNLKAAGEKKSTADADKAASTIPAASSNAGTDTSDLNVDRLLDSSTAGSSVGGDKPRDGSSPVAGGDDDENAVNKLTFWKSIDVKLDVPYYWEPERTLDFVYKKKPGFVRALEYGSKKFFENRTRLKKDYSNFEKDKRMQVVLENVDFADPEMLGYLNFDNSSLKPPSKFISEKHRKSYYDPLRKHVGAQQQDKSSGDDDGIGPAVMFGGAEEYDFMGSEEADHYVRVRIDKWQQAIKMMVDLRNRVNHYEQSYGVEEPVNTSQALGSLNHGYSVQHLQQTQPSQQQQQQYSRNNARNHRASETSALSAVLMDNDADDQQHYTPAVGGINNNNRNTVQKPTPIRRSTRSRNQKRQQSETSSDDEDDEDDEEESEEEEAVPQQQKRAVLARGTQQQQQQQQSASDAAKRLRTANKPAPAAAAPALPPQAQQLNKHNTRNSTRYTEHQQQQNVAALAHSNSTQHRYQPASTHGLIEPSVIFPATSTSSSNSFDINNLRSMVNQHQAAAPQNNQTHPNSSLYVRADEPHEVQRLLQQGWTISGLLPAPASNLPSMANGTTTGLMPNATAAAVLHAQQQQQHSYHRNWN